MRARRIRLRRVVLELILVLLTLVVVIPFYMIVVDSFKNQREAAQFGLGLPSVAQLSNYREVLASGGILKGYINSLIVAAFSLTLVSITAALAAFSIQRNGTRLTNTIYYFFVVGLVIPVAIVPTIKLMMTLRVHNTYVGMILYYSAVLLPFAVFLLTGYLKTLPRELDESAGLDGCRPLRIFTTIVLPLMQPALVTSCLLTIMTIWNDFLGPFYLLSDSDKWTVTVTVFAYIGKFNTNWGSVFADITIVIVPILVFYFLLQRYIVEGMTAGALKG
ncbi:MAG: carbohydrate ABC transporter permease [Spirochaetia bacterium]